ncbi:hypothetical protein PAECIP111802_02885 [Paenibacillus allorhizosphaerae]|uniref:Uncharacterized protein n=1 Tax=Paenibacillus allorhizosphaerae TaxID=2849866 RepID=A0ABN7TN31_9BACL|nr:hypothetical protein PAECIP111802_02885 [Paenibacillus allorhizosphaerae]
MCFSCIFALDLFYKFVLCYGAYAIKCLYTFYARVEQFGIGLRYISTEPQSFALMSFGSGKDDFP